jgi:hypothetical protein
MTLILDLPPDLEAGVNNEAARRGISPTDYLVELVRAAITTTPLPDEDVEPGEIADLLFGPWTVDEPRPTNGAEVVAYWERHGVLGSRPDITDSQAYARELRRQAERRDWS